MNQPQPLQIATVRKRIGYTQAETVEKLQAVASRFNDPKELNQEVIESIQEIKSKERKKITMGAGRSPRTWYSRTELNQRKVGAIELAELAIAFNVPIEDLLPKEIADSLVPASGSTRGFELRVQTRGFKQYLNWEERRAITLFGRRGSNPIRYIIGAKHYAAGPDIVHGEKRVFLVEEEGFFYASSPDLPGLAIAVPDPKDIKRIYRLAAELHYEGLYKVGAKIAPVHNIDVVLGGVFSWA
jgi:transcriptional regulator with XRE-family HTH domain